MTRPRVLFVDDEPRVLDGLRRSLRGKRHAWEMSFVGNGAAALELLGETPQDVVVSDMRMPGMDGAELLTTISRLHPGVARVVLSGHTEPAAAIKVAIAGHRFLTKPADVDHVISVIAELTQVQPETHGACTRRLAGAVRTLPTPAAHIDAVTALLRGPDADLTSAVRAVSHNVGLAAKLLQLSRSPFFTMRNRTGSMDTVINAVGLPTIQALVNTGELLWSSTLSDEDADRHLRQSLRHAMATADLVGSLASPGNRPHAMAAALLQDVGRFVCLAGAATGGEFASVDLVTGLCAGSDRVGRDCGCASEACAGVPRREVGVELLRLWGLPSPIVTAVACRDTEQRPTSSGLGVSAAVRAAHLLLQQTDAREPTDAGEYDDAHDEELAALLAHPQLTTAPRQWPEAARKAADRVRRWPAPRPAPSTGPAPSAEPTPAAGPAAPSVAATGSLGVKERIHHGAHSGR